MYHNPVLLHSSIDGLSIKADGVYVDVTYGGGGHSKEILKRLGSKGKLIAFDQDKDAIANKLDDERLILVNQNFKYLKNYLRYYKIEKVDGILADLGVSSHQFDKTERGFTFREDSLLDMRMSQKAELSALNVINEYGEEELVKIFKEYGELREGKLIARKIIEQRSLNKIETSKQLVGMLTPMAKRNEEHKFFAKVFQALRIEVNNEIQVLAELLKKSLDVLKIGGRMSVISYHSLEDRLVKNFFRSGNVEGKIDKDIKGNFYEPFKQITRKPIVPDEKEIEINNRARSAKLRIAERKE